MYAMTTCNVQSRKEGRKSPARPTGRLAPVAHWYSAPVWGIFQFAPFSIARLRWTVQDPTDIRAEWAIEVRKDEGNNISESCNTRSVGPGGF